jgi:hypothetical protein
MIREVDVVGGCVIWRMSNLEDVDLEDVDLEDVDLEDA